MVSVVAGSEQANRAAKRLLDGLLGVIGLTAITWTAWQLAANWAAVDLRATALSFVQPVVLTLAVLALTYVVSVVSAYEWAFIRLQYPLGEPDVRRRHKVALLVGLPARRQGVQVRRSALAAIATDNLAARCAGRAARVQAWSDRQNRLATPGPRPGRSAFVTAGSPMGCDMREVTPPVSRHVVRRKDCRRSCDDDVSMNSHEEPPTAHLVHLLPWLGHDNKPFRRQSAAAGRQRRGPLTAVASPPRAGTGHHSCGSGLSTVRTCSKP